MVKQLILQIYFLRYSRLATETHELNKHQETEVRVMHIDADCDCGEVNIKFAKGKEKWFRHSDRNVRLFPFFMLSRPTIFYTLGVQYNVIVVKNFAKPFC